MVTTAPFPKAVELVTELSDVSAHQPMNVLFVPVVTACPASCHTAVFHPAVAKRRLDSPIAVFCELDTFEYRALPPTSVLEPQLVDVKPAR